MLPNELVAYASYATINSHRGCKNPSIQVLMVEEWYATPSCEEERYVDDTMKENIHLDHIEVSLRSGRMTNIEPNHQVARLH